MNDRAVSTLFKKVNDLQVEWNERIEQLRSAQLSQQLKLEELSRQIAEAPAKIEAAEASRSAEVAQEEDVEIPSEDVPENVNGTEEHTMAAEVVESLPQPQNQQSTVDDPFYTGYHLAYECKKLIPVTNLKAGGAPGKGRKPIPPEPEPGLSISVVFICVAALFVVWLSAKVETNNLNNDLEQLKANFSGMETITIAVHNHLAREMDRLRGDFYWHKENTSFMLKRMGDDILSMDPKNKAEKIIASKINARKIEKVKSMLEKWNINATDIEQLMKEMKASSPMSDSSPVEKMVFSGVVGLILASVCLAIGWCCTWCKSGSTSSD